MDPFLCCCTRCRPACQAEADRAQVPVPSRVGKRKLERVQSGLDLFSVLLETERAELGAHRAAARAARSLRRQDLLRRLDDFEAGARAGRRRRSEVLPVWLDRARSTSREERDSDCADLRAAFDIICDNVGKDWRRLARQLKVSDAKIDAIEEKYPETWPNRPREEDQQARARQSQSERGGDPAITWSPELERAHLQSFLVTQLLFLVDRVPAQSELQFLPGGREALSSHTGKTWREQG
ncbi:FAS-associated death domain protein [Camelus dromedarius]|uniref:FAS-associated death domain protein n=1 Tax=Camelus dromedarius TaxID=9838 RepID=A0A5N4BY78_CAMDR|nr:FAS-associated death domain protein [Camelus dromedarius]